MIRMGVGECLFWYWPTRVVPDKRPLNGCVCVHCVVSGEFERYIIVRAADLDAADAPFYVNINILENPGSAAYRNARYLVNKYMIRQFPVNPSTAQLTERTQDDANMLSRVISDAGLRILAGEISDSYFSPWRVQKWFDVPAMMEKLPKGTRLEISRTFDNGFQDEYVYVSNGPGRQCIILTQF